MPNLRIMNGYTLIESITVLAIIAVVGAISTPSFLDQISHHEAEESALTALTTLQLCRSQALTTRTDVECILETVGDRFTASLHIDINDNGTMDEYSSGEVGVSNLSERDFTHVAILFNKYGFVANENAVPDSMTFCSTRTNAISDFIIDLNKGNFLGLAEVPNATC